MAGQQTYTGFTTEDEEYWDPLAVEYIPTLFFNGQPVGFTRQVVKVRSREKTTEYRGIPNFAEAATVGGTNCDFDAVSATFSFTKYQKRVSRRRINEADMWRVIVREKWSAVYVNGTWSYGAAESNFTNN